MYSTLMNLKDVEKAYIELALKYHKYEKTKTALFLGIARSSLYRKIVFHKIKIPFAWELESM